MTSETEFHRTILSKLFLYATESSFSWDIYEHTECLWEFLIQRRGGWSIYPAALVHLWLGAALRMLSLLHFVVVSQTNIVTSCSFGENLRQKTDWHIVCLRWDTQHKSELTQNYLSQQWLRSELSQRTIRTGHWKYWLHYLPQNCKNSIK